MSEIKTGGFQSAPRSTHRALQGCGRPNSRGVISYAIKSQDRKGLTHRIAVRVADLRVDCTCEWFQHKLARLKPTLADADACLCKHIRTFRGSIAADVAKAVGA